MTSPHLHSLPTTHRDYEVEITFSDGTKKVTTFGHRTTAEKAEADALDLYKAESARVLRVIREHSPEATPIADLSESWAEGRFILTDSAGRPATSEHGGGHLMDAFSFLAKTRPHAAWKTLGMLRTLRQAFREDRVNGHDHYISALLEAGPKKAVVNAYPSGARCRDRQHHGTHTF